jgi:uncharacterized membrane protein YoaK (UPF0700 family)
MIPEWSALSFRTVPVLLGFVAGYVDGCTFVALFGLFVAQVTGSFVIAGAVLVAREHGALVSVLAIPVFLLGAAVATATAWVARHRGWRASPIVLGLESTNRIDALPQRFRHFVGSLGVGSATAAMQLQQRIRLSRS